MHKLPVLCLCILSTTCTAAEKVRHSAGPPAVEQQVLQQLDHSHEIIEIEADTDRFSLLYRPAMRPVPRGALLIMPDPGVAAGWLRQSQALTAYLPDYGWAVLTVEPPPPPSPAIPERTRPPLNGSRPAIDTAGVTEGSSGLVEDGSASSSPAETDNGTDMPAPSHQQQLQQRLTLAWQELEQRHKDQPQVLVGIGKGAAWSAALAASKSEEAITLILIDPLPDPEAPAPLETLLQRMPSHRVIDLYHAPLPGYPNAEPDARQRRLLAGRLGLNEYHQSRLPGVFHGWQAEMPWLVRHTRGMLERILPDTTVADRAEITQEAAPLLQTPPGRQNGTAPHTGP